MQPLLRFSGDVVHAYSDSAAEPIDRADAAHFCCDFEAAMRHYVRHGIREYLRRADETSYMLLCETLSVRIREALNEIARGRPVRDDDAAIVLDLESGSKARSLALRVRALASFSRGEFERGVGFLLRALETFDWRCEQGCCIHIVISGASRVIGNWHVAGMHAIYAREHFEAIHPREVFRRLTAAALGVVICPECGWWRRELEASPAPTPSKNLMVARSHIIWSSALRAKRRLACQDSNS